MFSLPNMPSTTSVLSIYTTLAASAMLVRTILNEVQTLTKQLLPQQLRQKILSMIGDPFGRLSPDMTLIINEYNGYSPNEVYQAAELYLASMGNYFVKRLKVYKASQEQSLSTSIYNGETVLDFFEGIQLKWELLCTENQKNFVSYEDSGVISEKSEYRSYELSFNKKHMEKVLNSYLPYTMERSEAIKNNNKVLKLHSRGCGGYWNSISLNHPSTFDTLAMDPDLKKELIADLDRFVKRREFYRRVGRAWKRGYLLYGPPGTGKSSLVAAMANYLKFDIYDLELTSLHGNSDLTTVLTSTANRSILVIEDIDCSIDLQNRENGDYGHSDDQKKMETQDSNGKEEKQTCDEGRKSDIANLELGTETEKAALSEAEEKKFKTTKKNRGRKHKSRR
ncbi:ATPase, AAA-type, core [Dillenia turbinata]|uniref:ATPase, AAA-type, core n=1 Tax=Dillenia turbinata TaxID=194707 RepID=A0AAN8VB10_9MAGN